MGGYPIPDLNFWEQHTYADLLKTRLISTSIKLRKLGGGKSPYHEHTLRPNAIAYIVTTSRGPRDNTVRIKRELKKLLLKNSVVPEQVKADKAQRFDGISPEFHIHLGKFASKLTSWLLRRHPNPR